MPHSASRSAHGVVHWPMKKLPKPPWIPTAELREAKLEVCATLFERSIDALVSTCAQAERPAPMFSRARTPMLEACEATSHFDADGMFAPPAAAGVPSPYFMLLMDMWMVPYTSTCASAAAGAASAPATASDNSFFCIR